MADLDLSEPKKESTEDSVKSEPKKRPVKKVVKSAEGTEQKKTTTKKKAVKAAPQKRAVKAAPKVKKAAAPKPKKEKKDRPKIVTDTGGRKHSSNKFANPDALVRALREVNGDRVDHYVDTYGLRPFEARRVLAGALAVKGVIEAIDAEAHKIIKG